MNQHSPVDNNKRNRTDDNGYHETVGISVVYARPYEQRIIQLNVALGTSVADAVTQSDIARFLHGQSLADMAYAVFGKLIKDPDGMHIEAGDRIELCAPLIKQKLK